MNANYIPYLPISDDQDLLVMQLMDRLYELGFEGTHSFDQGRRLIGAMDNSIYQRVPQAILSPQSAQDIAIVIKVRSDPHFNPLSMTPRGSVKTVSSPQSSPVTLIERQLNDARQHGP